MVEFIEACKGHLHDYWVKIIDAEQLADTSLPQNIMDAIKKSINSKTKTYRYVLPTHVLAKLTNPALDSRSIQASSGGVGAFDARSLCHNLIVPFDKANQNVLGGSPEPYVNNPLRVPMVSPSNREHQKDKDGWDALCVVLDAVEASNDPRFTELIFKQILIEIHRRLAYVQVAYPIPTRISFTSACELISEFIQIQSGGEHPQAIAFAIFKTIGERFELYSDVVRSKVNTSDASSEQVADIECFDGDKIILAVEVKDKTLTVEQMKSKIDEARSKKVSEILFIAERELADPEASEELISREFSSGQNVHIYKLMDFIAPILILLGEDGRGAFIEEICHTLDTYADVKSRQIWAEMLSNL